MKNLKKCTLFLLIFVIVFAIAGCNMLESSINKNKAKRFVEEFIESADMNLLDSIKRYSSEKIESDDLIKPQRDLYVNYSKCEFEIEDIQVDEDNFDNATCNLVVKYRDINDVLEENSFATSDEYYELIRGVKANNKTFKLKLTQKNGEWKFDDLSDLYESLYKPYTELVFVDRIGIAINPDVNYYQDRCVTSLWYDPYMAVPLDRSTEVDPIALQCAFYFERPITQDFEARLVDSKGNLITKRNISMKESVIAICDFSCEFVGVSRFAKDQYNIELYYDNELIGKTSSPITVK